MQHVRRFTCWIALGLLSLATGPVRAATPGLIQYQSVLQDDDGDPIQGPVNVTFRIFAASSGGTALWTEAHSGVAVDDGVFHVVLGSITPFPGNLFDQPDRYLETAVNGSTLAPRRQFLSTPYALRAAVADVALSGGGGDTWAVSGDDIYRADGRVGIGETSPLTRAHIQTQSLGIDSLDVGINTDLLIESTDAFLGLYSNSAGTTGSGISLVEIQGTVPFDAWDISRRTSGSGSKLQFNHSAHGTVFSVNPDSRVGIGTDDPASELHILETVDVNADITLEKSGGSSIQLKAENGSASVGTSSAHPFRLVTGNAVRLQVEADGDVGIGTVNPAAKLEVAGTMQADRIRVDTALGSSATPDAGGVYEDNVVYAWGQINGAGTMEHSYGIASVARLGPGWYRVTYLRSLPDGAAPIAIAYSANDVVNVRISSSSATRCEVRTSLWVPGNGDFMATDYRFLLQVTGRP